MESKERPLWEQLELIIANIQRQLAPDAVVKHDERVKGKSGRFRKLDVTVRHTVSSLPVFIVFDAKLHKRKVGIGHVEKFAMQMKDVKANLGVMVSNKGYDAGAVAVAAQEGIILQSFRAAEQTDWHQFAKEESWQFIFRPSIEIKECALTLVGGLRDQAHNDVQLFDGQGQRMETIQDLFLTEHFKDCGSIELGVVQAGVDQFSPPRYVRREGKYFSVERIEAIYRARVFAWPIHMQIVEGEILQDFVDGKVIFQQFTSEGIEWQKVIKGQTGIEMTEEELADMEGSLFPILNENHKFIRFKIQQKP